MPNPECDMAQQVGSTSGAVAGARETAVTPGGASGEAEAGWQQQASEADRDGQAADAGMAPGPGSVLGTQGAGGGRGGPRRGWLRRSAPQAAVAVEAAPSVVAAGPDLNLASNDPLVGYLLSAASAV